MPDSQTQSDHGRETNVCDEKDSAKGSGIPRVMYRDAEIRSLLAVAREAKALLVLMDAEPDTNMGPVDIGSTVEELESVLIAYEEAYGDL